MSRGVRAHAVTGALGAALALVLAASRAPAAAGPARAGAEAPCLVPTARPREVSQLVAGGLAVLRRAGHSPADYALELEVPGDGGEPSVVFWPREESRHYAVAVRPEDPCALSWVWRPERFTTWQAAVLERAGSLLGPGLPLAEVAIVETAETVTVRLRHAPGEATGSDGSEGEVTLLKSELCGSGRAGTASTGD